MLARVDDVMAITCTPNTTVNVGLEMGTLVGLTDAYVSLVAGNGILGGSQDGTSSTTFSCNTLSAELVSLFYDYTVGAAAEDSSIEIPVTISMNY